MATLHDAQQIVDRLEVSVQELIGLEYRDRAEQAASTATSARDAAQQARQDTEQARDTAEGHASAAATSETNAGDSAATAGDHAAGAAQSEDNAYQSETTAGEHRQAAETARSDAQTAATSAQQDATQTGEDRVQTGEDRTVVEGHRDATLGYRNAAEGFRDQAQEAARNAEIAAPAEGWSKAELHEDVRTSLSRADSAMQSMPEATDEARGAVRLSGDLAGSANAPTVPGLSGKSDVGHRHDTSEVDGLDTALASKADTTYVDQQIAALRTEMHQRPAWWDWDGTSTFTPPDGAVAGDRVINWGTSEVHALEDM